MFAYCNNNPISRCDPNGYCPNALHGKLSSNVEHALMCTCSGGGGASGVIAVGAGVAIVGLVSFVAQAAARIVTSVFTEVREFAKTLRQELAEAPEKMPHIHHIAPWGSFSNRSSATVKNLQEIRQLFIEAGINIYIDPMNLMLVSAKTHASLHTDSYIAHVHDYLMQTDGSRLQIYGVLFKLRIEIAAMDAFANGY